MDNANPTPPTSPVDAERRAVLIFGQQLAESHRLAKGIADSMMEMTGGDLQVVDSKRWDLFRVMLKTADHELGRAVR